jgi:hypothetical protein
MPPRLHPHAILSVLLLLAMVTYPAQALADDDAPHRAGFTLELGLGASYSWVNPSAGSNYVLSHEDANGALGLSGLSLSLGSYVTPQIALVARAAGTSFWADEFGHGTHQTVNGIYGGGLVAWPTDDVFLGAGVGFALFTPITGSTYGAQTGLGLDLRAGVAILNVRHHALTMGIEALPAFYGQATVVGGAFNLEWHYF